MSDSHDHGDLIAGGSRAALVTRHESCPLQCDRALGQVWTRFDSEWQTARLDLLSQHFVACRKT